jgi:transcriptional antiterminator NusG
MKKWYAIQTYAGSELKVKEELEKRVRDLGLEKHFEIFRANGEESYFLAPIEEVITSKSRRGRAAEYRVPYSYELKVESNQRINRGDLLALKAERTLEYDAKVVSLQTLQRVIIELTNRNEEVYKIPEDKRIRRDIRVGEKVPANVPLTTDRDPKFFTKVKGKVVDRSRIRQIVLEKPEGEQVIEEVPERYLVKLKEGLKLKKGDLLEKEDRIESKASGMVKIKEYKDKRVITVQRIEKRRLFPGYVFGKMEISEEILDLVSDLKARFVGDPPLPVPEEDMKIVKRKAGFLEAMPTPKREQPVIEVDFEVGEVVEIVEGPFADFTGEIVEIDKEKEEVTVMVKIFGRETPVKLGFDGIEKL